MSKSLEEVHFNMIDQFFKEHSLVDHHLNSVNQFYETGLKQVLRDLNPLTFSIDMNKKSNEYAHNMYLYLVVETWIKYIMENLRFLKMVNLNFYIQMRLVYEI